MSIVTKWYNRRNQGNTFAPKVWISQFKSKPETYISSIKQITNKELRNYETKSKRRRNCLRGCSDFDVKIEPYSASPVSLESSSHSLFSFVVSGVAFLYFFVRSPLWWQEMVFYSKKRINPNNWPRSGDPGGGGPTIAVSMWCSGATTKRNKEGEIGEGEEGRRETG